MTATVERRDVVRKTVVAGAIIPRNEIAVKARISGVVEKVFVESGSQVKRGAPLAKIRVIPRLASVHQAQDAVRTAEIHLATSRSEFERFEDLKSLGLFSGAAFAQQDLDLQLREQRLEAARQNLELVRYGSSKASRYSANVVRSTVKGTVLEVPVKEGASVIETNNFNEGTTIATVADMSDLVLQGHVDELEAGQLKLGMPVSILIGALGQRRLEGALEHVAPKGVDNEGTIQFGIRARVALDGDFVLRANYSANADIILDRREDVLAVNETWITYEDGESFVEVQATGSRFERRAVQLGLSDGLWSEVVSGLQGSERIKTGVEEAIR